MDDSQLYLHSVINCIHRFYLNQCLRHPLNSPHTIPVAPTLACIHFWTQPVNFHLNFSNNHSHIWWMLIDAEYSSTFYWLTAEHNKTMKLWNDRVNLALKHWQSTLKYWRKSAMKYDVFLWSYHSWPWPYHHQKTGNRLWSIDISRQRSMMYTHDHIIHEHDHIIARKGHQKEVFETVITLAQWDSQLSI